MAGVGVDGGDHPIRGHLLGDAPAPVGAIGALDGFHVLAGDQRQQRHRLGGPRTQLLLGQMPQQPVRIADQRIHQLLAGLRRRPRRSPVYPGRRSRGQCSAAAITSAAPGTSRRTRRIAPISWVTVSWVATASSSTVESSARRVLPVSAPVCATTALTASKIRLGRSEAANRRRQYVNVVA